MGWLGLLMNPAMLGLGLLAIASPILIHLLNKRRFKIVNWAAIDFLLEAEKKNRRRVRLENIILLLLRCLAMLLIGLLLARPFLPSSVARLLQENRKFERIIVLDDSLSQRVPVGNGTSFDTSITSIKSLITSLADSTESEDWMTLLVTSRPDDPVFENMPVSVTTTASLIEMIDELECADRTADYPDVLNWLRSYVSSPVGQKSGNESAPAGDAVNRVTYLYSDMRKRDWIDDEVAEGSSGPVALMDSIAAETAGSFVIDVGGPDDQNLAVTRLEPDDLQVANKVIGFSVDVTNFGSTTVSDIRVLLQVDESPPAFETIASIAPGETEEVIFRYLFNRPGEQRFLSFGDEESALPGFKNYRVRAEINRQSLDADTLPKDQLIEDSSAVYASRVLNGIPVLLVDGAPSGISERSETHYLKGLALDGTGLDMRVGSISDLETESLSNYKVIFVCNVDSVSRERMKTISAWVEDGGALVLMPGDQVRSFDFNSTFYDDGQGLSPIELTEVAGNSLAFDSWFHFEIDPKPHPSLDLIVEHDASSLSKIPVFSWFKSSYDREQLGKQFDIPLWLNDPDHSPVMVDRAFGDGRVIVFTIPADGDWSLWAGDGTYMLVMLQLIDYLVGGGSNDSMVEPGGRIAYPVDLSAYKTRVALRDPDDEKVETVAEPLDNTPEAKSSELYRATFNRIADRGFYEIELNRHSGETESVLFASNYDPAESDLERIPDETLANNFFSEDVSFLTTDSLQDAEVDDGLAEIWLWILVVLFGVLMLEQYLGWYFGKKR